MSIKSYPEACLYCIHALPILKQITALLLENERMVESLEAIASFSCTTSSIGGDDRINKVRNIARAALGKE